MCSHLLIINFSILALQIALLKFLSSLTGGYGNILRKQKGNVFLKVHLCRVKEMHLKLMVSLNIFGCTFPVIVCYSNVCLDGLDRENFDIIL